MSVTVKGVSELNVLPHALQEIARWAVLGDSQSIVTQSFTEVSQSGTEDL
jgi:hypothetical protein